MKMDNNDYGHDDFDKTRPVLGKTAMRTRELKDLRRKLAEKGQEIAQLREKINEYQQTLAENKPAVMYKQRAERLAQIALDWLGSTQNARAGLFWDGDKVDYEKGKEEIRAALEDKT